MRLYTLLEVPFLHTINFKKLLKWAFGMLNPKGAALSPLSLRPRWEALCAVPRADMHKQNPTLENIIFSPHATLFLLLHTGQAVFTEHPLACEAGPPNVRKIQIHSYPQTLPAAPSSASAWQWPSNYWTAHSGPAFQGPTFIQCIAPTYTFQITFKLCFSLVFPKQTVGTQQTFSTRGLNAEWPWLLQANGARQQDKRLLHSRRQSRAAQIQTTWWIK